MKKAFLYSVALLFLGVGHTFPLKLNEGSLIHDGETQEFLEALVAPALKKTNRIPLVRFYIIMHPAINAFTAGEPFIFLHTGLIEKSDNAGELAGVLFHELGHIAGHHVIQQIAEIKRTRYHNLIPALVGLMAAGITGRWEAAPMGLSLGQLNSAVRQMGHSREQEYFADNFSLSMLHKLNWPVSGFADLMKKLAQRDGMDFPLYLRTHPFAKDRVQACVKYPVVPSAAIPQALAQQFECVKIKVIAFCEPLSQAGHMVEKAKVPQWVKPYGQAIVAYRLGHFSKALDHLKHFETAYKSSPFTQELRAQILFESGQVGPALAEINQALAKRPHNVALALLKAQIALESPTKAQEVIPLLERLRLAYHDIPGLWHWLGIAYGKANRLGRMKICLAEEAVLEQEWDKAIVLVKSGLKLLTPSDPYYHQGQDLETFIKREKP